MKHSIFYLLFAVFAVGCTKPADTAESESETAPETSRNENLVVLTKENLENVTIKTEPATVGSLGMTLKAIGRVSLNLNQTAKVTPTLEGRLTRLNYDLNDRVKAGDVLALVESPELLGRPLELKAPVDGVIVERAVATGELVDRSTCIYTISDPTRLWLIAEVNERDIAAVKLGQKVTFSTLAYRDETFPGKVVLVGNQVESGSRTVEVRIAVDNADGRLKAGMFADVQIVTTVLTDVLQIPDTALQTEGENQVVFVALADNQFEKRTVKPGLEQAGHVQILDGVKAGENVVVDGGFILKSELLKDQLGEE